MNIFKRLLNGLLFTLMTAAAVSSGQAPSSVAGLTYRDEYMSFSTGLSHGFTFDAFDLLADGTFVTRLSFGWSTSISHSQTIIFAYGVPTNGTYTYQQTSSNQGTLILIYNGGSRSTRDLIFTTPYQGQSDLGVSPAIFSLFPTAGISSARALTNTAALFKAKQAQPITLGFVIGGTTPWREVLIRAIGPSLAQFGINDFAPNPSYTISNITPPNTSPLLLPGGAGQAWAATSAAGATILAEGQRAGAFPLVENSNDKADVVLLSPGAYTITVNPTSADGEGTELIEVYEVE